MSRFIRYLSFYNSGPHRFAKIELTSFNFKLPWTFIFNNHPTELIAFPDMVDTASLKIHGPGGGHFDMAIKDKIWWYRYFSIKKTEFFYITKDDHNYYISFPLQESEMHQRMKKITSYEICDASKLGPAIEENKDNYYHN